MSSKPHQSGQELLALIRQAGTQSRLQQLPAAVKFAFNQMVTPAIRGAGMPAFSGLTAGPKIPTAPQPAVPKPPGVPQPPKPKTLGGNTPTLNPIGLLGQISTMPGKITGDASFSGAKMA